jgi:predicted metal-dependent peptidase
MPKNTEQENNCTKCSSDDYEIIDVFGVGSLTDVHMDADITEDELAQRFQNAAENARRMGGKLATGFLEELGALTAPKMTWEDFVAITIGNKKEGIGNNDWGSPRSRALFYGQYLPKKKLKVFTILVLVDRSGSVPLEDATYGISQIQVLGLSIEGYVVCFDTVPYYDTATRIESGELGELLKIQYTGGGGTVLAPTLYSYEKELGQFDLVVVLTDGGIFDLDEISRKGSPNNNTDFVWVITGTSSSFKPPFGRAFRLKND